MKSNKQRRKEIKARRLKRAEKLKKLDTTIALRRLPRLAVEADVELLAQHNNSYGIPEYYVDVPFRCRDCGSDEIWTAKQQKWWYEVVLGDINSTAVRCRRCRKIARDKKDAQKAHMIEMANREPHPNEQFFRKKYR